MRQLSIAVPLHNASLSRRVLGAAGRPYLWAGIPVPDPPSRYHGRQGQLSDGPLLFRRGDRRSGGSRIIYKLLRGENGVSGHV